MDDRKFYEIKLYAAGDICVGDEIRPAPGFAFFPVLVAECDAAHDGCTRVVLDRLEPSQSWFSFPDRALVEVAR